MDPNEAAKNLYTNGHLAGVLRNIAHRARLTHLRGSTATEVTPGQAAALEEAADRLTEGGP